MESMGQHAMWDAALPGDSRDRAVTISLRFNPGENYSYW
jgi:hypothetical protein